MHASVGTSGSYMLRFRTMQFLLCDFNDVCNYASPNEKSFCLSTTAALPITPMSGVEISSFVRRCTVCDFPAA